MPLIITLTFLSRDDPLTSNISCAKQMLRQMSGPPGVHVQLPAEKAGRAEPVSVLLPHSPPSAPDPCARTAHAITQSSALVSAWLLLLNVAG